MPKVPTPTLRPWRRGDPLEADKLDETRQFILQREALASGGVQVRGTENALPIVLLRAAVFSVEADHLVCVRDDGGEGATLLVAKPYQLRNSIESRDGVTYTYTNTQERDGDDGVTQETQVVTPSYVVDDIIFVVGPVTGGTGVADALKWLDLNLDGRAWAVKAE